MQPVRQSADQCCGADAESKTMFAVTRSVASKPHSACLPRFPAGVSHWWITRIFT